jgi:hypothetical protein|tara:strand:+ start:164 stop:1237 length:1074 start_codon:yes stop_codon:yes gene_type:complete
MMNDATQPDATEEEVEQGYKEESTESQEEFQEKPVEEELSPREKAIEDIVATRNENYENEVEEVLSPDEEEEYEEVVEEVLPEPVWKDGDNWYTTIKVDGEDIKVPFSDLRVSHQKDRASQKRFEEAAEYGRRVQAKEQQLNAHYQQMMRQQQMMQHQEPPSQDVVEEEPQENNSDLIKQYHEALYEDNADKAAELFTALTAKGRAPSATQDVDQAVNQAVNRLMAQQQAQTQRQQQWAYQKSMEDAVHWFNEEYPDVAEMPELRAIADNQTLTLIRDHPDWAPKQIIQEAAENTRQWVKDNVLSSNKNERMDRKKKIAKHPKAANASSKIGEDEPAPQSASDIIQEMKHARGQVLS